MKEHTPKKRARRSWPSLGWVLGGIGVLALAVAVLVAVFEPNRSSLCATSVQRSAVRSKLETTPTLGVQLLSESIGASIATTLDAFPEDQRVGVAADQAPVVWESMRAWPSTVVDVMKGGADFEIVTPLPPLNRKAGSRDLVIGGVNEPLYIRLRGTDLGAVYAFIARTKSGDVPSVVFLDRRGEILFRVVPSPADLPKGESVPPFFLSTFRLMESLPVLCDAERS